MSRLTNMKKCTLLMLIVFVSPVHLIAQHMPSSRVGIETAHLLDLFEGETKLANGYTDIDLKGMEGSNTQFDVAFGFNMEVPLKFRSSLLFSFLEGEMTSQFENQYAKSELTMVGFHYRQYFINNKYVLNRHNPNLFYARPFYQFGVGVTSYKGERYFVKDQGLFSITDGFCTNTSATFGCSFEFGRHFQVVTTTDFILNLSDAIDGYDNDKKSDIMQKTGVSLMYRFK